MKFILFVMLALILLMKSTSFSTMILPTYVLKNKVRENLYKYIREIGKDGYATIMLSIQGFYLLFYILSTYILTKLGLVSNSSAFIFMIAYTIILIFMTIFDMKNSVDLIYRNNYSVLNHILYARFQYFVEFTYALLILVILIG